MNQIDTEIQADIRGTEYIVAVAEARCPSCSGRTPVVALAVPGGHERLMDAAGPVEDASVETWNTESLPAFLFHLSYLPTAVQERLRRAVPTLRFTCDAVSGEAYWANHCGRCGARFDDVGLFCEVDGAFLPMSAAAAAAIEFVRVSDAFVVAAAGYSSMVEPFETLRRG